MKVRLKDRLSFKNLLHIITFIMLLSYSLFFVVIFLWGFMTSLKTDGEFILNRLGLPKTFRFRNYIDVFNNLVVKVTPQGKDVTYNYNAIWLIINSLLYACGCTFFACITPLVVAFCCAYTKYRKINRIIEAAVVIVMIVPIIGQTPAQIMIARAFGWYDKMWGIWVMNIAFTNMYFLIYYASFKRLSSSYREAAFIDGAGWFTVFFRIYVPLVSPTITSIALLLFIGYWNAYEVPMMFVPSKPTLSLGLYWFKWNAPAGFKGMPYQIAVCYILLLPIFIAFIIFRKRMMGNLTMGGLKG